MSQRLKQVLLTRKLDDSTTETITTWLPVDPRIMQGVQVELKNVEHTWTVKKVFDNEIDMDILKMNWGWSNNI